MKHVLVIILISFVFLSKTYAVEKIEFGDVKGHWAESEITLLVGERVINGYEDGSFRPNNCITVSEFLKILVEMEDYRLVTEGPRWPNWYIETAIKNNIIERTDFEDYSRNITRGEASKIISEYIDVSEVSASKNVFSDLKNDDKKTVLKLVKLGVLNGYSDGTFRSENPITRAEACKIVINAYKAKRKELASKNAKISSELTNIHEEGNKAISNTYEIKNSRLYFYDTGRYAKLDGQTVNQEYVNDKKVIKLIDTLIGNDSYTEVKFVPDKYIINRLDVCFAKSRDDALKGSFAFEIRFYENSLYDASYTTENSGFTTNASMKITVSKMWDKLYELRTPTACNERYLNKLEDAIGVVMDNDIKEEMIKYILEKKIQAINTTEYEDAKIVEVKKMGKYTINTFCLNGDTIEIFIQKF